MDLIDKVPSKLQRCSMQDCRERLASLEEKKWFFTCFVILSPHDFCIRWLRQWPSKNSKVLQRLLYTTTSQAKQYLRDTEWQSKLDSFNSVSARTVLLFTLNLLCAFSNMYDYSCTPRKKNPSLKVTLFFSPNLQKVQNCKWQQKICEATDTSQWLEVTLNFVEICLGTVLQGKNCKWRICMVEQQQLSTWMTILLKSLAKDCVLVLPCVLLLYSSFSRFTLGTCIQAPRPTKNRWESKFPARYAFS